MTRSPRAGAPTGHVITRDSLERGGLAKLLEGESVGLRFLTEEELAETRRAALRDHPGGDLWLFGYGSLIWNPAFRFAERRIGRLLGYHRRFCLWTPIGRGTPERPGLVLGLMPGGSCGGVAFRVEEALIEEELTIVWRREMLAGSYRPRFTRVRTAEGDLRALTFVINPEHDRYAGRLSEDEVAGVVARASGRLGPCRDYLDHTVDHLHDLGIRDARLTRVREKVRALTST